MKGLKYLLIGIVVLGLGCSEEEDTFDEVAQYAEDLTAIDKYITDNNLANDTLHHWTGIRYIIHDEGTGIDARVGDKILVDYKGYFLDDEVFDEGLFGDDPPVILNSGSMISGWYYMCQEMSEGDVYTIFLPSVYAYGENGSGTSIPPNTPLVFDLELIRVGE